LWDRVKGYIKNIVITVSIVILQASRFNLRLACFILSNVAGFLAQWVDMLVLKCIWAFSQMRNL